MGVYSQVEHVVRSCINLVSYSCIESLHEVHPQVVCGSCLAVLFQLSVELRMVDRLSLQRRRHSKRKGWDLQSLRLVSLSQFESGLVSVSPFEADLVSG